MYYKFHKVNFRRGGSYIDSPDWIKNKIATINPKNEDDKHFQYATTVALNQEEIKRDPERISKTKSFVNKYNQKGVSHPSKIDYWKAFEKNNPTVALIFRILKKMKYAQPISQKLIRSVKNK